MENSPVLNRPMFRKSSPLDVSVGLGSMSTPDQNAQELRNMFAPVVSSRPPEVSFPVPQQNEYRRGGEVINGVAHFQEGGETVSPPAESPVTPVEQQRSRFYEDVVGGPASVLSTIANTRREFAEREKNAPPKPGFLDYFMLPSGEYDARKKRADEYAAETLRKVQEDKRLRDAGIASIREEAAPNLYAGIEPTFTKEEVSALDKSVEAMPSSQLTAIRGGTTYTPPPKPPSETELTIESIRARRERKEAQLAARKEESIKQREENKWLGILAAGLGMMASKSRTLGGGIGEGGLEGLRSFQASEKVRREDEATARREDLTREQMAQQLDIAKMQLAKDPDSVRLITKIGGGDFNKGYEIYKREEAVKAAKSIFDAPLGTPGISDADREWAVRTIRGAVPSGGGQFPGFTPVAVRPAK
jgi:hypothetical protein